MTRIVNDDPQVALLERRYRLLRDATLRGQGWRWRGRDAAVLLKPELKRIRQGGRLLSAVAEIWEREGVDLMRITAMEVRGQALVVRLGDHASMYELDRQLAAGLRRLTIESCKTPIRSIKLKIGAAPARH